MRGISSAYHGLRRVYHRLRGRTSKPQTIDLGRRDATRRIVGTVGVAVGAAAGATSLGALLGACKEKSMVVKPKTIKIVANSIADAAEKTKPYGFAVRIKRVDGRIWYEYSAKGQPFLDYVIDRLGQTYKHGRKDWITFFKDPNDSDKHHILAELPDGRMLYLVLRSREGEL